MSFWTPVENPGTRPLRSWVFDVGCALFAAAGAFGSSSFALAAHSQPPALAVSLPVAVLTALVVTLRRVWPGPVFAVVVLLAAVLAQWPVRGELFPIALAIALYTVAVTMSRTEALVAAALAVAAEAPAAGQGGWHNAWLPAIYEVIAIAAVLVAGLYVSTRRAYLAELRDRAERLEREHDQTSALAAAMERARIAREMHDSVAHHLTVIVALSDGALAAVTRSPAQASEAIRGVSSTAREALAETRRLLGILRADSGLELRQPLPGLSDLEGLFTRVRAAGLPVRYERSGPPADTPPRRPAGHLPARPGSPDEHDEARRARRERGRPAAARPRRGVRRSHRRRHRQRRSAPRSGRRPDRDGQPRRCVRRRTDVRPASAARLAGRRPSRPRHGGGTVISVLLVDDHSLIRMGFRLVLEAETDIEVAGEAADGAAAFSMCSALRPDVVLMDVRMPGRDGIEATRDIVAAGLPSKVLILTTFDLDNYVYAGLRQAPAASCSKTPSLLTWWPPSTPSPQATPSWRRALPTASSASSPLSRPNHPAISVPPRYGRPSPAASKRSFLTSPRASPTARSRPPCSCPRAP